MSGEHPPLRVLIVDDERLIRWSLAQTLLAAGATVIEAADARSAMEAIGAQALGTPALLDEARALGALGVIEKPFELHTMTALLLGAPPSA